MSTKQKRIFWAIYNPNFQLIAMFTGAHGYEDCQRYFRERCSELCTICEYAQLNHVQLTIE